MKKYILIVILCGSVVAARAASEEALALARDIIKLSEAPKLMDNMMMPMKKMTGAMLPDDMPAAEKAKAAKMAEKMTEKMIEIMKPEMEEFMNKMAPVYADVFTVDELKAMKAFHESPAGRALIAKQPQLMEKMMPAMMEMMKTLQPKIMEAAMQEAKAAGE